MASKEQNNNASDEDMSNEEHLQDDTNNASEPIQNEGENIEDIQEDVTEDDRSFLDKLTGKPKPSEKMMKLETEKKELEDKYLRLFAEFDNFKRRTAKERIELIKTAGKDVIIDLLPVLDDIDRALRSEEDKEAIEGMTLILSKLTKNLEKKGLKVMDTMGEVFTPDIHEAITEIPAPSEDLKGKVVDVIEKGYTLNDKIIRYSKVVVGK